MKMIVTAWDIDKGAATGDPFIDETFAHQQAAVHLRNGSAPSPTQLRRRPRRASARVTLAQNNSFRKGSSSNSISATGA